MTDNEKKLGEWCIKYIGDKPFTKHGAFWQVCIKSICQQNYMIAEYGVCNPQNVLDYVHNKINYDKNKS